MATILQKRCHHRMVMKTTVTILIFISRKQVSTWDGYPWLVGSGSVGGDVIPPMRSVNLQSLY
ncbi:hypothetical protein BH10PSE18_BH10PSE18_19970 [soil metagenome]